jgi:hypothetical protein
MTIQELIDLVSRRLAYFSQLRTSASNLGDTAQVASLDTQLAETEATLAQIKTLLP